MSELAHAEKGAEAGVVVGIQMRVKNAAALALHVLALHPLAMMYRSALGTAMYFSGVEEEEEWA